MPITLTFKKKPVDPIEPHGPTPDLWGLKSAIQKAYRRNNALLFRYAFTHLWEHDPSWVIWRAVIFPAEENWKFVSATGKVSQAAYELLKTKSAADKRKAGLMLYNHFIETMAFKKNKDGDGVRTIADLTNYFPKEQAEMYGVLRKKMPEASFDTLETMTEVERLAQKLKKVDPKFWELVWKRYDLLNQDIGDDADVKAEIKKLHDQITAAELRSNHGGMLGDRTMMVAVALLSLDAFEYNLYNGLTNIETSTNVLTMEEEFDYIDLDKNEYIGIPPLIYDMHTSPGKTALSVASKKGLADYKLLKAMWFYEESALVNETSADSIWWEVVPKVSYLLKGVKPADARALWKKVRPELIDIVKWAISKQGGK